MNIVNQTELKSKYFILMGFAGAVGLSWNSAINSFIMRYFPIVGDAIYAKIFYAIFLTLILILITEILDDKKKIIPVNK